MIRGILSASVVALSVGQAFPQAQAPGGYSLPRDPSQINVQMGINSDILKNIPPTDIQARIAAMQAMANRARNVVRRHQLPVVRPAATPTE